MIYIDTSCLIKVLLPEPDSPEVHRLILAEDAVIISSLAELEAEVQLKAGCLGGAIRVSEWRQITRALAALRQKEPFAFRSLAGSAFQTALRQHRNSGQIHCRSLDRLHLAGMEELGLYRLLTNDQTQAAAARAQGFEVLLPSRK